MVDYSLRTGYLLALEGGNISALSRSTGVSRRTLRRMLQGREATGEPAKAMRFDPEIRERLNRSYRRRASNEAKRQEAIPRGPEKDEHRVMPELQTETQARAYEATMLRLGLAVRVSARISVAYKEDDGEIPLDMVEVQFDTVYSHGSAHPSVEAAKQSLIDALTDFINEDHNRFGNSPVRVIIDPLPDGWDSPEAMLEAYGEEDPVDFMDGEAYVNSFRYRVWRPMREE